MMQLPFYTVASLYCVYNYYIQRNVASLMIFEYDVINLIIFHFDMLQKNLAFFFAFIHDT